MTYRDIASRQVLVWAGTAVAARMPVAMTPLALVFLVRERPGGYSLGAALAAAYVLGEIVAAPVLGTRLDPERGRRQLTAGLAGGALGFTGLGVFAGSHPLVLGACAFLAGAAPSAAAGGQRALLTSLVPERAVAQALSAESMLMSGVWAVSPVAVAGLALAWAPRVPLLLAAVLMALSVAGHRLLPAGWAKEGQGGRANRVRTQVLLGAWPVYVTGAASITLLGLAELTLPALLEQRGIGVGWSGPLLAGMAVGAGAGAFVYGLRSWPGRLRSRSVVLMCGMSVFVALLALIPEGPGMATALILAGILQSGALITRNLSLRDALPPGALAAGYSVLYAAAGAGYAATGSLAGALLRVVEPSTAMLAGVGVTLLLTAVGWWGEARRDRSPAPGDLEAGPAARAEGAPVAGGGDPERGL
ncbi:MFS transporter [Streptomyces sp. SS1-1]|uniref:MFS transporter n=1 Tax=unclassified Streptomyces TaxID=2593676 RepID=UPI001250519F|nr:MULTISPECIES: MFS transporter [unclassified Streptomyces]KAB2973330.1 MFS transporter [Streptomyces sp. SS1-1]MDI9835998.1 MFS transporter [Streptomyces sp. KAU_LT]